MLINKHFQTWLLKKIRMCTPYLTLTSDDFLFQHAPWTPMNPPVACANSVLPTRIPWILAMVTSQVVYVTSDIRTRTIQAQIVQVIAQWPLGDFSEILDIFKLISVTDGWGISCKSPLRWMPLDLTDDKSTLVPVMVWCRQATSHYLRQCWPRSVSPYGVIRPQWVKKCDVSLH